MLHTLVYMQLSSLVGLVSVFVEIVLIVYFIIFSGDNSCKISTNIFLDSSLDKHRKYAVNY